MFRFSSRMTFTEKCALLEDTAYTRLIYFFYNVSIQGEVKVHINPTRSARTHNFCVSNSKIRLVKT